MIDVKDFDLGLSFESGQPLTFHADYSRKGHVESLTYSTISGEIRIRSMARGRSTRVYAIGKGYSCAAAEEEVVRRFGLDEDLGRIYARMNTDPFMERAIAEMAGMRLTRNDPWETTLCFIISQFNNIKRIRLIVGNMKGAFGEKVALDDGRSIRLFPRPEALARAGLGKIRACGTGFRDRYIQNAAREWIARPWLAELSKLPYDEAKEALLELDGIGDKVADCILLFGYGKREAFPIDTWIKRIVEHVYFNGRRKRVEQIHRFADRRWPGVQGYAQQYLFWFGRQSKVG